MTEWIILGACFFSALIPALMFLANIKVFAAPSCNVPNPKNGVSILIPARNEELSIEGAIRAAMATSNVPFEIIVLDDHSTDKTASIVESFARQDSRVKLLNAPELPAGWCGKQHACFHLAQNAHQDYLLFQDADVRLAPDCAFRMISFMESSKAELVSGIPHQVTLTLGEKLLIPLIHFVLLGFLPFGRMRKYNSPAYASGCGQAFLAQRESYFQTGGHSAIKESLHDGIKLPAIYRKYGLHTDLCDITNLAECRMYRGFVQVWNGLAKNATEGMAKIGLLPLFTVILFLGQVAPVIFLPYLAFKGETCPGKFGVAAFTLFLSYLPRFLATLQFRQSWTGALLHPAGIVLLLTIQWYALARQILGRPSGWKGRNYPSK